MKFLLRLIHLASFVWMWPAQVLSRTAPDGALFFIFALLCGLLSIGSYSWSNIPLLLSLSLIALWFLAMGQGTRSLRGIEVKRNYSERTFANEAVWISLFVSNSSRLPSAGVVVTEVLDAEIAADSRPAAGGLKPLVKTPGWISAARSSAFITIIPGNGSERAKYSMIPRRRGIYRFGETRIETVQPFGFFRTTTKRSVPGRMVVYPGLGEVDTAFLKELELALQYIQRSKPSRAEEDIRGLREYREGDNPKWIHWKSTARMQRSLVKEFEEPQSRRVLLLIDTNLQRLGMQRFPAFELVISFAATLSRELLRRSCEVECVALQASGRLMRVVASRERRNLDMLLEMLAGLKRDDTRTLADMINQIPRRSLHHAYVLALGLGSLRSSSKLGWLHTTDNIVKIFDGRGAEFRQVFQRGGVGAARGDFSDEELVLDMGEEDEVPTETPMNHRDKATS